MLKSLKKFTATDISAFLFVAFEIAVFPLIQFTPGDVSAVWSYIAIVLVGVMALLTFRRGALDNLIRVGILFTLIADYFLVLDGEKQLHGVLAFICVQAMYFSYLFTKEKRASVRKINLLSRIFVSLALVLVTFIVYLPSNLSGESVISSVCDDQLLSYAIIMLVSSFCASFNLNRSKSMSLM